MVARTAGVEREPDGRTSTWRTSTVNPGDPCAAACAGTTWWPAPRGSSGSPDEENVDTEDVDGQPRRSVRGRVRRNDLVARTAGVEREPDEENVDTEDVDGQPRRSVRGRVRRNDLVARTAGVEREPDKEDVDMEDVDGQPRRSVRGRVRRNDLVARTAGVEREPDTEDVDMEDVDGQTQAIRARPRAPERALGTGHGSRAAASPGHVRPQRSQRPPLYRQHRTRGNHRAGRGRSRGHGGSGRRPGDGDYRAGAAAAR